MRRARSGALGHCRREDVSMKSMLAKALLTTVGAIAVAGVAAPRTPTSTRAVAAR
ncbi:hypothetical protein GCM10025734_39390 [Kitasatospora paranensis]